MPKIKVYLDTSVLGAVYDTEDPSRVTVTKQLLGLLKKRQVYIAFISNVVIEEIEEAPPNIRNDLKHMVDTFSLEVIYETETCVTLVEEYVKRKIIPRKYRDDARHIAVAVVNDIDVIITWNCRHMAQVEKKRMINAVNMMLGYRQIDIVTPLEVVGDG
jgi:predicted nucleic acid-binding protein